MAKTSVLVVHRHDPGEGSTILAVLRDNTKGRVYSEQLQKSESANGDVEIENHFIIEVPLLSQISKVKLQVLHKIRQGKTLAPEQFKLVSCLMEEGYLETRSIDNLGLRVELTPLGRAITLPE